MSSVLSRLQPSPATRRAAAKRLRQPRKWAKVLARLGLAARTCFYLLLVYLIIRVAVEAHNSRQTNAHGAIATVAQGWFGIFVLVVTAAGFAGFGGTRLWAVWREHANCSLWTNVRTVLQGLFYLVLAWIPLSYALGNHSTGKEQQQHQTVSDLLSWPGGPVIVFVLGVIVCVVAAYQIKTGLDRDYLDGMAVDDAPRWVRRAVLASGVVGIPARALVFLPIGVFFMIAAVMGDPSKADGIDRELTSLTGSPWGYPVLALCALGLLVFVAYSALETRYRQVARNK